MFKGRKGEGETDTKRERERERGGGGGERMIIERNNPEQVFDWQLKVIL